MEQYEHFLYGTGLWLINGPIDNRYAYRYTYNIGNQYVIKESISDHYFLCSKYNDLSDGINLNVSDVKEAIDKIEFVKFLD